MFIGEMSNRAHAKFPAISPNGNRLTFISEHINRNIYRIDINKKGGEQSFPKIISSSTREDNDANLSPDGSKIVFRSTRSGSREIWISDSDGKMARPITSFGGPQIGSPTWSPSGELVAFECALLGNLNIYVISGEGDIPKALTTDQARDAIPRWSRDGQYIYFHSNRTGNEEIWRMTVTGHEPVQVTKNGGYMGYESEDGKWFYFSKRFQAGIWKIPLGGGQETKVVDDNIHIRNWILKENGIYYMRVLDSSFNLEYRDLVTNKVRILANVPGVAGNYIDISPDNTWILYTKEEQVESDIMLVENFR